MRKASRNSFCLILLSLLLITGCSSKDDHPKHDTSRHTCPMHPQIVSDEPGICPICKMDLVPVASHGKINANDSLKYLVKPTDQLVQSQIATVKPQSGNRFGEDVMKGVINYNTNNWNSISSKVSGRIERLYVKYNYQPVSKGQKIMDIYSPELANAQQELLFLKENNEPILMESARRKLQLLGMNSQQIRAVLRSGKVDYTTSVYSKYTGYISEGAVNADFGSASSSPGSTMITGKNTPTDGSGMGEGGPMGGSSTPSSSSAPAINSISALSIREGQYVTAGQKMFDLINATSVWAEFYLRPEQLGKISRGTELHVSATEDPSLSVRTKVSLIQPYYNEANSFTVARAVINNAGKVWRVGQLVNVNITSKGVHGTWVPRKAVLQMGGRYVLFVKEQGGYKPVYVNVSTRMGDWVDIGKSLSSKTEIAANAWFMVDSESFVKPDSIKQ